MAERRRFKLQVASPCTASWEEMKGDDRVRFCGECELNVYNLSAMPHDEAEALVEHREGRLCVRFYEREDGTVLTQDCPVGKKRSLFRTAALVSLATGLGLFKWLLTAEPNVPMGDIAPPAPPPDVASATPPSSGAGAEERRPRAIMGKRPNRTMGRLPVRTETGTETVDRRPLTID